MIHLKLTTKNTLSVISRVNGMMGWMVRNFILNETNINRKIYKTLISIRIEYCTQARDPVIKYI